MKSLEVRNFQSIASVSIELGGVTVVTGPSSSGKSALVRAVRAALTNPRGTHFVRTGTNGTAVALRGLPDDVVYVKRLKGASGSVEYRTAHEAYTAVGISVPDDVAAMFNMDAGLQVVDQFDAPYLLTRSPSEVARSLAVLTRTDVLLGAVAKAAGHERTAGAQVKLLRAQSDAATAERESLRWITGFLERLQPVKAMFMPLRADAQRLETLRQHRAYLSTLVARRASLQASQKSIAAQARDLAALLFDVNHLLDAAKEARAVRGDVAHLTGQLSVDEATIEKAQAEYAVIRGQLQSALAEGSVCPTCGQALDEEHLLRMAHS